LDFVIQSLKELEKWPSPSWQHFITHPLIIEWK
jgi:hypothetical protein